MATNKVPFSVAEMRAMRKAMKSFKGSKNHEKAMKELKEARKKRIESEKMATKKISPQKPGLKKNGTLKKGYKYAKGGKIVKVGRKKSGKAEQPDLFFGLNGGVLRSKRRYTKGSKSNRKADSKRTAMKPGKRISKNGKVYYEYRKNRSDVKGRT